MKLILDILFEAFLNDWNWATGDSVVSKGQVVGMTGTASRGYTAMYLAHMIIWWLQITY